MAEHQVRERVREREPLQHHRAGGVDEDEGDAAAGERGRYGVLARRGRALAGRRSRPRHARHDDLGSVAVLQQRDEVGERPVVGLHVELAAPEAGDAVVEHVAGRQPGVQARRGVREALGLALRRVAGAPALRRLVAVASARSSSQSAATAATSAGTLAGAGPAPPAGIAGMTGDAADIAASSCSGSRIIAASALDPLAGLGRRHA